MTNSSDESEVRALDRAWNKAYQTKNVSTLAQVLADDWLGLTPEHEVIARAQLLEDQQSASQNAKVVFTEGALHLLGTLALTTGEVTVTAPDTHIHQRFTRIYTKRDSGWQAVAVQVVPIPII